VGALLLPCLLLPLLTPLLLLLLLESGVLLLLLLCATLFVLLGLGILPLLLLLLLLLLAPGFGVLLPLLLPCRLKGSTLVVPPGCRGVPDTPTWKRAPSRPVSSLQQQQQYTKHIRTGGDRDAFIHRCTTAHCKACIIPAGQQLAAGTTASSMGHIPTGTHAQRDTW
jgi:hypothetical protein